MSKAKALRFARVEAKDDEPAWVEASQAEAGAVAPLQPPSVGVPSIDDGSESGNEAADGVVQVPSWANWEQAVAPLFGGEGESNPNGVDGRHGRSLPPEAAGGAADAAQSTTLAQNSELNLLRGRFEEAVVDLATARQELLAQAESQILDLAIRISETIIETEVEARPELHESLVKAALRCVEGERSVELQVAPAAFALLCERFGGSKFEKNGVAVVMHEKAELHGLGCVVETGNVRVDGRVHQRLLAVRRSFEEMRLTSEDSEP